jgi:hypothetical protein
VAAIRRGNRLELYVDGQPAAQTAEFDTGKYNLTNNAPLRIGFGPNDYFRGRLSDVRLYDRPLTADELALLVRRR